MSETCDVLVVGAGVIGASVAMQLSAAGLRVVVVDRLHGPGQGSTAKSSAHVSCTYSYEATSRLAFESLQLFEQWADFVRQAAPLADFRACGCLQLTREGNPAIPRIQAMHHRVGIPSETLGPADLPRRFPAIDFSSHPVLSSTERDAPEYRATGIFEPRAGYADAVGTVHDYLAAARAHGARLLFGTTVVTVEQAGGRVSGATVDAAGNRTRLHTAAIVNCAGPWAARLNTMAGVPLPYPLVNIRAQMVHKTFPERLPGPIPLVRDRINNFFFRLEANGTQFHVGSNDPADLMERVDPDAYKNIADPPLRDRQLALLRHRVPALIARGEVTSYAGLYCNYTMDNYPVIDRSDLEGFFYAIGLGGEGFKMSPVVGMMISRLVTGQVGRGTLRVPHDLFRRDRQPMLDYLWETQRIGTEFISAGPLGRLS